ncbi:transposase [Nostoc cf. edaphicum LEGE 07299]|uniref:Transposase n=1 Tax=Nostoc cf. edaphicum LEGE 07299 TaxID=2777974 RepID=A0ABR9U417_9NOSO|nr:transposase [Nostoc edaphicum]MBE9107399.1 transposase [Nostoc cf. edaphicum LEGE 07299]
MQKLRAEYWTTIGEINLADLIFIDEAGVNIAMTRRFARSPQGSRAYGDRPDGRGKNVTMIGAMSLEGIIAAMTFTGGKLFHV